MKTFCLIILIILSGPCFPADADTMAGEPLVSLTESERAWLDNHPDIKLGFSDAFEPALIRNSDNTFSGIVVDFLDEINKRLGVDIGLEVDRWPTILEKVEQNELGGVIAIFPGNADARGMLKTRSHFTGYPTIYGRTNTPFMGPADLTGKKIAHIQAYYLAEKIVEPYRDTVEVVYTNTALDAMQLVYEGKVDFMVGETDNFYLVNKYKLSGVRPVYVFRDKPRVAVTGVRSDWPELVSILNKGIATFSREELDNIYAKWIQVEFPQRKISLTPEEQAWLKEHPVIRVGAHPAWAPLEFRDKSGAIQGISVDYLERIRKMLGIEFEFIDKPTWDEMLEMTRHGELDLLSSVKRTPSREQFLSFTESYIEMPVVVFSGPELTFVSSLEELSGRRAAVVKGNATEELLRADHPDIILVPSKNTIEALHLLARGEVDVFVSNLLTTSYYLGQLGYSQIKVAGNTPYLYNQTMGVRKDWSLLTGILQKALDAISPQERNLIRQQWVSVKYEHKFDYTLLWKVLAGVIFVFGSAWIVILFKQINERRQAETILQKSNERFNAFIQNSTEDIYCFEFEQPIDITLPAEEQIDQIYKYCFVAEANDAWARAAGFEHGEDLLGLRMEEILPRSNPKSIETLNRLIASRYTIRNLETLEFYSTGETRNVVNNGIGVIENGHLLRIWATGRDITKLEEMKNSLKRSEKDLQKLAGWLISRQEKECSRIARELHDDLTQQLAVIAIEAGNIEEKFMDLPEPVRQKVSYIKDQLIKVSGEVHNLSRALHPSIIDDLGLERAVRSECSNYSKRTGIAVVFKPGNIPVHMPAEISLAVYRIIQEGLLNVSKHGKTKTAYVILERRNGNVALIVRDDGVGFDPKEVRSKLSLGLSSMRERIRLLNGKFSITSAPRKGTSVEVEIPLKQDDEIRNTNDE